MNQIARDPAFDIVVVHWKDAFGLLNQFCDLLSLLSFYGAISGPMTFVVKWPIIHDV